MPIITQEICCSIEKGSKGRINQMHRSIYFILPAIALLLLFALLSLYSWPPRPSVNERAPLGRNLIPRDWVYFDDGFYLSFPYEDCSAPYWKARVAGKNICGGFVKKQEIWLADYRNESLLSNVELTVFDQGVAVFSRSFEAPEEVFARDVEKLEGIDFLELQWELHGRAKVLLELIDPSSKAVSSKLETRRGNACLYLDGETSSSKEVIYRLSLGDRLLRQGRARLGLREIGDLGERFALPELERVKLGLFSSPSFIIFPSSEGRVCGYAKKGDFENFLPFQVPCKRGWSLPIEDVLSLGGDNFLLVEKGWPSSVDELRLNCSEQEEGVSFERLRLHSSADDAVRQGRFVSTHSSTLLIRRLKKGIFASSTICSAFVLIGEAEGKELFLAEDDELSIASVSSSGKEVFVVIALPKELQFISLGIKEGKLLINWRKSYSREVLGGGLKFLSKAPSAGMSGVFVGDRVLGRVTSNDGKGEVSYKDLQEFCKNGELLDIAAVQDGIYRLIFRRASSSRDDCARFKGVLFGFDGEFEGADSSSRAFAEETPICFIDDGVLYILRSRRGSFSLSYEARVENGFMDSFVLDEFLATGTRLYCVSKYGRVFGGVLER